MLRKNRVLVLSAILMGMCLLLVDCNSNNNSKDIENKNITETDTENEQINKNNKATENTTTNDTNNTTTEYNTLDNNENQQETLDDDNMKNREVLARLLPEKEGYKWVYNGSVDYGHRVILNSIEEKDNKIIYSIEGEVDDLSDGESESDYTIKQKYIIENGKLIQQKEETMMMDSNFDSIVLIQMPLEVGNKWQQKINDKNGNEVNLNCFIKDIEENEGKKICIIRYEDEDSSYYEERKIKEGIGTITFRKLYKYEEDEFEIGYGIYMDASGY